jgi:hypothetical protein
LPGRAAADHYQIVFVGLHNAGVLPLQEAITFLAGAEGIFGEGRKIKQALIIGRHRETELSEISGMAIGD